MSRSQLPLPPVPAASRPAGGRAPARTPSTTAAPFQAVPTPEHAMDDAPPVERRRRPRTTAAPERPRSTWHDAQSALATTGPSGLHSSGPAPRLPRQTTPAGSSAPAYGDWTKPSRSGDAELPMAPAPLTGPGTTAIPERSVSRRGRRSTEPADRFDDAYVDDRYADDYVDDRYADEAPARSAGPVTGGRAAMRAERQARDAARRKAQKQRGSAVAVLEEDGPRKPRRVLKGLIAMAVVALGVLGVYTVVSPETEQVAAQTPSTNQASTPAAPPSDVLPDLEVAPLEVAEPTTVAPIRLPVTVLNSTDINGLAAKIAATVAAGGWEAPGVGAYTGGDIAASTIYFTEGDEQQRQAAIQLKEQFPQLQGPSPRFFELPADVPAPGLVVVATGDWQP